MGFYGIQTRTAAFVAKICYALHVKESYIGTIGPSISTPK